MTMIPYDPKDWWRMNIKSTPHAPGGVVPYNEEEWYNSKLRVLYKNVLKRIGIDENKYYAPYTIAERLGIMCVEGECEEGTIGFYTVHCDEETSELEKVAIFPKEVFHDMKEFNKSLSFMLAVDFINLVELKNDFETQKAVEKLFKKAKEVAKKIDPNYVLSDEKKKEIESMYISQKSEMSVNVPVDYETLLNEYSSVSALIDVINKYGQKDEQKIF